MMRRLSCWLWGWRKGPWTEECRWPLDVRKGKDTDSPLKLPERAQTYQHLDFRSSIFQNCKIVRSCCFKPLNWWRFVIAAIQTLIHTNTSLLPHDQCSHSGCLFSPQQDHTASFLVSPWVCSFLLHRKFQLSWLLSPENSAPSCFKEGVLVNHKVAGEVPRQSTLPCLRERPMTQGTNQSPAPWFFSTCPNPSHIFYVFLIFFLSITFSYRDP